MLSPGEHAKLEDQLKHIPSSFTKQQKQDFERMVKKKLKEHFYASRYPPFQTSPYELVFVNRTTSTNTLTKLINIINRSTIFTLDTESTKIKFQPNKPSLIQIQVIQPEHKSIIIFVEVCHLLHPEQYHFILIKQLFYSLLQPTKNIFIWGNINELEAFTKYNIFTLDQIRLPHAINVQTKFREYWSSNYPHRSTNSSNDTSICNCLICFGITHNNLISIQDAVAITLNRWIDKRLTCHPFDIGLDPRLQRLNDKQLEYRQCMSNYALNDCDAVKQIIIYTNIIDEIRLPTEIQDETLQMDNIPPINAPENIIMYDIREPTLASELEPISDDNDDTILLRSTTTTNRIVTVIERLPEQPMSLFNSTRTSNYYGWENISSNDDDDSTFTNTNKKSRTSTSTSRTLTSTSRTSTRFPPVPEELSQAERKKIHNRSSTLRQRNRCYQHEIIRRNIDGRFTHTQVKNILRQHHIPFNLVNISRSKITGKYSLYIGIRDPLNLRTYTNKTRYLFTVQHYKELHSYRRRQN